MVKMNADSFFSKGKSHTICQDFSKSGVQKNGLPYAIVCDGCSSSPDTDTGARLLAHSASAALDWLNGDLVGGGSRASGLIAFQNVEEAIIQNAKDAASGLKLNPLCLDSTLMIAYASKGSCSNGESSISVNVIVRGDGAVLARNRQGMVFLFCYEQKNNAPDYLSYKLDEGRYRKYHEKFGHQNICSYSSGYQLDEGRLTIDYINNWTCEDSSVNLFFDQEYYDLVMLFSDGISSFQKLIESETGRTSEDIPAETVIADHMLKIPNFTGAFLQRRCNKFLRYCQENQWHHGDDFSAAAIWME